VYKKRLYQATLKNQSRSGLFFATDNIFLQGESITVSVPDSKNRTHVHKARIVWCNKEGCGIELLE
jgi:Tfp pilus assembly protein PilZ